MDARDRGAGVDVGKQDAEHDGGRKTLTAKDAKSAKNGGKLGNGMNGVTDVDN